MNLALSDEQVLLREAAREALSRVDSLQQARSALDHGPREDLWPIAKDAGWPGLLIGEEQGGAGLGAFDAMLVLGECGRRLAQVPLLGHLPASAILIADGRCDEWLAGLAGGQLRAAYLPASPPTDIDERWSLDPMRGWERAPLPVAHLDARDGDLSGSGDLRRSAAERGSDERRQAAPKDGGSETVDGGETVIVNGTFAFVPDAPGADLLVGVATLANRPVGVAIDADSSSIHIEAADSYDGARSLGHVTLRDTKARLLQTEQEALADAWHLAQALIAAESIGAVEAALEISVAYAKERHTFGRPIGSYQAVKHSLTEVLRQLENGRSLLYYAGWSREGAPEQFPLAANAARCVAGRALEYASRTMIAVHGGIGATWEHDAPLYFRRAQLTRRLLGGTRLATDRVAGQMLAQARAAP